MNRRHYTCFMSLPGIAPRGEPHPIPQPPTSHHPPAANQNTTSPNPAPTKTPAAHQPILPPVTNPRQKRRTRHPGQSRLRARRGRVSTRGASERVFDRQGLHSTAVHGGSSANASRDRKSTRLNSSH